MTSTLPLIIYIRVSRVGEREGESFRSPREQEDRARAWAENKGYPVRAIPADPDLDVSGAVHPQTRPGMRYILDEIRAGRAGGITADSIDRFSRDPTHGDWLVNEVTTHGGLLTAPDMPEDITSPTGEFTWTMLLGVARLYRRTAGARFKAAQEYATRAGIPVGPVPLGYRAREDRSLEIDPETAPIIREMFDARAAGYGMPRLAKLLSERTGRRYTAGSMAGRIENPLYRTGRIEYRGVTAETPAGGRLDDAADGTLPGAIVDDALWWAAQRPKQAPNPRDGRLLLTGLLKCAECGRNLRPWRPARKQLLSGTAPRYRCDGDTCTTRVSVHAPVVEDMVTEEAFRISHRLIAQSPVAPDLSALEQELENAERRFAAIQTPDVQDALGDAWAENLRERRRAREEAAAALVLARQEAADAASGGTALNLGWIWPDLEPAVQKEALAHLFECVKVRKVPRGDRPDLEFVVRATRPYTLVMNYPEIETVD